jgi:DnaK suppressor protein
MSRITDADLTRLRTKLVRERDALLAALRAREPEQRSVSDRELESGDVAERMIAQEAAIRISDFDAGLLVDVEHALEKLDRGNYGYSEESGAPIPLDRLDAIPWARLTAAEAERSRR